MIIGEISYDNKTSYDESTGELLTDKANDLCKCYWYSSKAAQFEDIWITTNLLKLIERSSENTVKLNVGESVCFKSMDIELQKQKSSLSIDVTNSSNNEKVTITPLLTFISPIMHVIEVKNNDNREPKFDSKTEIRKRFVSSKLVKCKWYNPNSDKLSEKILPIETVKKVKLHSDDDLRFLNDCLKVGKLFKCKIKSNSLETLFKPQRINYKNGNYYVSGLDYMTNTVRETLSESLEPNQIEDNPFLKKGPTFEDFAKPDISLQVKAELIQIIGESINDKNYIRIIYRNRNENIQTRTLSSIEVMNDNEGKKTFVKGYCHLRKEVRTFRIERIQNLQVLNLIYE
jgi:hypothetical protein